MLDGLPRLELEFSMCGVKSHSVWLLLTLPLKGFKAWETFHYNGEGHGGSQPSQNPENPTHNFRRTKPAFTYIGTLGSIFSSS